MGFHSFDLFTNSIVTWIYCMPSNNRTFVQVHHTKMRIYSFDSFRTLSLHVLWTYRIRYTSTFQQLAHASGSNHEDAEVLWNYIRVKEAKCFQFSFSVFKRFSLRIRWSGIPFEMAILGRGFHVPCNLMRRLWSKHVRQMHGILGDRRPWALTLKTRMKVRLRQVLVGSLRTTFLS